jgi:hypothetical protein
VTDMLPELRRAEAEAKTQRMSKAEKEALLRCSGLRLRATGSWALTVPHTSRNRTP